jgi:hypothetical protein
VCNVERPSLFNDCLPAICPSALLQPCHLILSSGLLLKSLLIMLFHHFSTRALLTLLCSYAIPCLSLDTSPTLVERQETRTVDPTTSSLQLQGGAESLVSSPTTSYRLETATAPIQLADTIGLIMPNPWSKVYVGRCRTR